MTLFYGIDKTLLQHLLTYDANLVLILFDMLQDPAVDVLTLCTSQMLTKPAIRIVFDVDLASHYLSPVFKLLEHVVLDLVLLILLLWLILDWIDVKECHDLVLAIVDLDELLDLATNTWELSNVENTWSLVFVLV